MKKRILFVDDEPNILSSMKRMLRGMRKTVAMDFVESGLEALAAMEVEPYHVVISDMRMPGMDGADLLTAIRDKWPHTMRIMLTGQADSDSLLRMVNVVHKFLLKPCEQDEIKKCIERACELHSFLLGAESSGAEVDGFAFEATVPKLYQDIQALLLRDDCSVELLADCLSRDEWLGSCMTQLFQVARSDDNLPAITMVEAVEELGREVLRPLVLSLHLFQQLIAQRPDDLSFHRVLIHGMRVGHYAKKIAQAQQAKGGQVMNAFIGGLLHDIGYLVLANQQPEQYGKVVRDLLDAGGSFDSCEQDEFSFSHNKAGALLLVRLGFPLAVIEIAAYHSSLGHHPHPFFDGLTAVHVADSYLGGTDNSSCCFRSVLHREYLTEIGCLDKLPGWEEIMQVDV